MVLSETERSSTFRFRRKPGGCRPGGGWSTPARSRPDGLATQERTFRQARRKRKAPTRKAKPNGGFAFAKFVFGAWARYASRAFQPESGGLAARTTRCVQPTNQPAHRWISCEDQNAVRGASPAWVVDCSR